MKTFRISVATALAIIFFNASGANPEVPEYSYRQCEGSMMPYTEPDHPIEYPDSLEPVFINYVGRHGARYPASSANCLALRKALAKADSLGTITPLGRKLNKLNEEVIRLATDRWAALDSLGMAEMQGIATRMFMAFTEVFRRDAVIDAMSSYSPRAMMSMYSFTHQLDRLNNRMTFSTTTGRINSGLLRPFDIVEDYLEFRRDKVTEPTYDAFVESTCPVSAIRRVLGERFPFVDAADERRLALSQYYVVAGLEAMGLPSAMSVYFSREEAQALWSCFNMRQYLQRTATTLSTVPADIAADLAVNIIETTDAYISEPDSSPCAVLRFGHAETLMPLLSLLRIPGCFYMTNYFDTVAGHWRDFEVVPMAANIRFVLFKSRQSGRFYVRVDLNELPVKMRMGDDSIYYQWGELRRYMMDVIPLYAQ